MSSKGCRGLLWQDAEANFLIHVNAAEVAPRTMVGVHNTDEVPRMAVFNNPEDAAAMRNIGINIAALFGVTLFLIIAAITIG